MNTIKDIITNEIIINKSKFITYIYPVKNINEVTQILVDIRKKYYDSTHVCYAYIIGENQELQKCFDDGEPSKTAGAPMLNALQKNNLTNVLALTIRYFGGILLGAGGLVRAYSMSVSEAINKADIYETCIMQKVIISIDYTQYGLLQQELTKYEVLKEKFGESIDITLGIESTLVAEFKTYFNNVTRGKALFILDNTYIGTKKVYHY